MRVTTKGQVTIPINVREMLGIIPETDIDFREDNGNFQALWYFPGFVTS